MSDKKRRGNRQMFLLVLILIFLIMFLIISGYFFLSDKNEIKSGKDVKPDIEELFADTVLSENSRPAKDSLEKDSAVKRGGGVGEKKLKVYNKRNIKHETDTVIKDGPVEKDTFDVSIKKEGSGQSSSGPCDSDSIPPWVYPEPSGGLYYDSVTVVLKPEEPCSLMWGLDDTSKMKLYSGEGIKFNKSGTLFYRAYDSCKNVLPLREEFYEIKSSAEKSGVCPEDMALIKVGAASFCIDRYEWPNQEGKKPCAFVSLYEAKDSCYSAGKRLCSRDEWSIACRGAYSWKYPYGNEYEPRACNTRDTATVKSGTKRECRGYFDVYDMSGNLAEWTDTRSTDNRKFYMVMGGFFKSGPQSHCSASKYSYFPQNRHNPVGFRCCKDTEQ